MSNQTVYVIDRDPAARDTLVTLLATIGQPARTFNSAVDFILQRIPRSAGCLVLDIGLADQNGFEVMRELKMRRDPIPIILTSTAADIRLAVKGIKEGALDFIQKPYRPQLFLEAVQAALRLEISQRSEQEQVEKVLAFYGSLSSREQHVMRRVAAGHTNQEIADSLGINCSIVRVDRLQVMRKLGVRTLPALVRIASKIAELTSPVVFSMPATNSENASTIVTADTFAC